MLLKFGFILLGVAFCGYVFYCCSARYLKIKDLPENIISTEERIKYLKVLQKYVLISGGGLFLSLLSIISSVLELRIIIPLISTFVCCYILNDLTDEIADFDISKKDSIIITDFLKNQLNSAEKSAKENKIKKVDSTTLEEEIKKKEALGDEEKNTSPKETISDNTEEKKEEE